MLEIHDLSVEFGHRKVLRNVSFSLQPQGITVLVGRNGSGKSTLFGCVNQRVPYTGTIREGARDLARLSPRQRAKTIAILPQTLPAPHITGRELTAFGRNPYLDFTGRLTEEDRAVVEDALREADALDLAERYVDTLSGGERQRVLLAMILAQDTPIALLDEPTAHLDLGYEAAFLARLEKLKERKNKTFLVILHDLALAVRYADHLIVLDEGEIVFSGSREECLDRQILEKTFALHRWCAVENGETRIFFSPEEPVRS